MANRKGRNKSRNKRLNNAPAKSPQQKNSFNNVEALFSLLAKDGYSNSAAFTGEASPLISSGTFTRSYLTQDYDQLSVMYRESWLAMRIIDMPSEDMTRSWYKLSASVDESDIKDLRRTEAFHSVKQEITNAIRWGRLYGGAIAVMVIRGQEDIMDQPLDLDSVGPGDFRGLLVLDRAQGVTPSLVLENDLDDPDFGLPMYYDINLEIEDYSYLRVHHSRVLRFIGRELPHVEMVYENYWGASELEHVYDELQKRNATSANIAQLVFQANITTLKMGDFGEALALGTEDQRNNILNAIMLENRFRTSYGLQLLSASDTMENHQYTFSGLSDIYELFMMDISGAAEIPATKLFGRSPQGFNSTGESDLRNYYETIAQMQERVLRPALEKLVPVMAISCWGFLPDDMDIIFEPIAATTPQDRAELVSKVSDPIIRAFQANLISREEAIAELKDAGAEYGVWTKLNDVKVMELTPHDPSDPIEKPFDPINPYSNQNELVSSDDLSDDD